MSLYESMMLADQQNSFEDLGRQMQLPQSPEMWGPVDNSVEAWVNRFNQVIDRPRYERIDGFISPFASDHWGASADIMQGMAARYESLTQDRVDPNKIFTSDIAQLKTIQANHAKITKMFEHCLAAALTEKDKVGLNEDEVAAMQALNSAQTTLAAITKHQVDIKKAIAELKIKQQAVGGGPMQPDGSTGGGGRGLSAFDIGRSIMDTIHETSIPVQVDQPAVTTYPSVDPAQAELVLDNIVSEAAVSAAIRNEAQSPTTYVLVDKDGSNPEYITLSGDGRVMDSSVNPTTAIANVDIETGKAADELMETYDIKIRDDLAGV